MAKKTKEALLEEGREEHGLDLDDEASYDEIFELVREARWAQTENPTPCANHPQRASSTIDDADGRANPVPLCASCAAR